MSENIDVVWLCAAGVQGIPVEPPHGEVMGGQEAEPQESPEVGQVGSESRRGL